ncbi:hypothetical protein P9239_12865 [Caballeronia sp. LZ062]|uniref:hypothetical protein n=1 Tax=unclassified Caballeronia TaxID=2646786 RepID=UPI002856E809|nr:MULTISPECIES: hypothetical protein [unclassified Caballeronia]MDR5854234.1 hypothetical protein [Caballeronia sp. LZ050]MDR5871235.1 hypothetical protein [Caballeronia sp. LZ062]
MDDQTAVSFLRDVRHPLLALHRAVLAHLRHAHESESGPVSPGEFLQIVINGSAYRWLSPLSTLIAALDDVLDDEEATSDARVGHAKAVIAMFRAETRDAAFAERFLPLLQESADIAVANGHVVQIVRGVASA